MKTLWQGFAKETDLASVTPLDLLGLRCATSVAPANGPLILRLLQCAWKGAPAMARPRKSTADLHARTLRFTVPTADYIRIQKAAARAGVTVSQYLR